MRQGGVLWQLRKFRGLKGLCVAAVAASCFYVEVSSGDLSDLFCQLCWEASLAICSVAPMKAGCFSVRMVEMFLLPPPQ